MGEEEELSTETKPPDNAEHADDSETQAKIETKDAVKDERKDATHDTIDTNADATHSDEAELKVGTMSKFEAVEPRESSDVSTGGGTSPSFAGRTRADAVGRATPTVDKGVATALE